MRHVIPAGGMAKTIVHVHQQRIRGNIHKAPEEREPPVIVRRGRQRLYASEVEIKGPCRIVYSPDQPLDCGARLWIELLEGTEFETR